MLFQLRKKLRLKCATDLYNNEKEIVIGSNIIPVCKVLNSIKKVEIIDFCGGYPKLNNSPPYITFNSPIDITFTILQALSPQSKNNPLKFSWLLKARFNKDKRTMVHTIESDDSRIQGPRYGIFKRWSKIEMDAELLRMAEYLKEKIKIVSEEQVLTAM